MAPHFYRTNESVFRQVVPELEWQGPPIGAGWVDGHGCGLYIGYEETVVPCCKQESNITKFICVICDHVLPVRLM